MISNKLLIKTKAHRALEQWVAKGGVQQEHGAGEGERACQLRRHQRQAAAVARRRREQRYKLCGADRVSAEHEHMRVTVRRHCRK